MGYTHYWTPKPMSFTLWEEFTDFAQKIFENSAIKLGGMTGEEEPNEEFPFNQNVPFYNADELFFNGVGDDSHESFVIKRNQNIWNCCKTAMKSYDIVVVAMLTWLSYRADYKVTSDGDIGDWRSGIRLAANYSNISPDYEPIN